MQVFTYLCLPLWSTEPAESLSRGDPKPEKLLFFFVSITSFSRDTSSSRSMSFAARSAADFSSLAVGGDCTSLIPTSKAYRARKVILFTSNMCNHMHLAFAVFIWHACHATWFLMALWSREIFEGKKHIEVSYIPNRLKKNKTHI